MAQEPRERRPVRVQTTGGAIEGLLCLHGKLRTLDELNQTYHRFVRLETAGPVLHSSCFEAGPVDVLKDAILFLTEQAGTTVSTGDNRIERAHFQRMPIRLKLGEFDVQGFLHGRGVRDPMTWLAQARQPFVALTAASIAGPDTELAVPFVAVNPRHLLVAQTLGLHAVMSPAAEPFAADALEADEWPAG